MKDKGIKYKFVLAGQTDAGRFKKIAESLVKWAKKIGLDPKKEKVQLTASARFEKSKIKLKGYADDPSVKSITDTF